MPNLTALADRVEAAREDMSERDHRELSAGIAHAIGWRPADGRLGSTTSAPWAWCPTFTASLDAAMTLVPEPGKWSITAGHRGDWEACVWLVEGLALNWRTAATPALALTAAALRARAQLTDGVS